MNRRRELDPAQIAEASRLAREYLDVGYTCSQSVLKALKSVLPRLASMDEAAFAGFGGGFGRTGRVCGAVVASTAAISAAMIDPERPFERGELNAVLQRCYSAMEAQYGSLDCRSIVGLDFRDPEQAARYRAEKHEQVCKPLVGRAVSMVAQALRPEREP